MNVITSIKEMQALVKEIKKDKSIGFVPTMGYLHEGHIQLMKEARLENDIVVVSIFVNPLQFGPNEDYDSYPRDFERDQKICSSEGVDIIYHPPVEEMYPNPLSVKALVQSRTNVLCGESRPGHFDGVATVLTKLFNIVQPEKVYLGMKDAQQVAVVEGLISDFNFPIELIPVSTVREEDGLAKSSRNVRLAPEEREEAPELYRSLCLAKELLEAGERSKEVVISAMKKHINEKTTGIIDYVEIYSFPELEEHEKLEGKLLIALAVKFSNARLIDNIVLTIE
ncbi:pantoate--beta-alanine ligase [Robertmurraya sp. Marseille-Q9965]